MRAVGPQLVGAIVTVAAGWSLQMAILTGYSSFTRILLSIAFCICIYLVTVVGFFRLTEPITIAGSVIRDLRASR